MSVTHTRTTNVTRTRIVASVGFAALVSLACAAPAGAQAVAPPLGTAGSFAVLGTNGIPTSGTVTCTTSTIDGDVGSTGGFANTGCTINGDIDTNLNVAGTVVSDFDDAYDAVETLNPVCDGPVPTSPTTATLTPGVYCSDADITWNAGDIITLDGLGDADAVWVFRIGTGGTGALTGTGSQVVMDGGAQACNVYWWTAEAATMTSAVFVGNVLSGAAATMTSTSWEGRALATDDVTLTTGSAITGCLAAPPSVLEIPTLGPVALASLVALLAGMGLLVLRRLSI